MILSRRLTFAFCLMLIYTLGLASDSTFTINKWLVTGPLEMAVPLFADSAFKPEQTLGTLDFDLDEQKPLAGDKFTWSPVGIGQWEQKLNDSLTFNVGGMSPFVLYAASYVETPSRTKSTLTIRSTRPVAAWIDGKLLGKQATAKDGIYELSESCDMHSGKHSVIVKLTSEASLSPKVISLKANFKSSESILNFESSLQATHTLANFTDWAQFEWVTSPTISSDGLTTAVIRHRRGHEYKLESWIEIYSTTSLKLLTELQTPTSPSALFFMPNSSVLAYKQSGDNGVAVWGYNTKSGEIEQIMAPVKGVDDLLVSPDGKFFYYFQDEEEKENKTGYELLDEIEDRVGDFTRKRRIIEYSVENKNSRPLNELGTFALFDMAISREGRKLAFVRYVPRVGRPYYDTELWVYDLQSRKGEHITTLQLTESISNMQFMPGGEQLVYCSGGFSSLPTDTIFHNVNQHCLFQIDLGTKKIKNLTAASIFSIQEGNRNVYVRDDRSIVIVANHLGKVQLFQAASGGEFSEVRLANPHVESVRLSGDGRRAVYLSSRLDRPLSFWTYDFNTKSERIIVDPNAELSAGLQMTPAEDWTFTNSDGYNIDGWIMKPPNFDPTKKYPLIVYYYGGVSPRDERFSFTYQWWCANGYVLYILNPRGCVGYGQEFADFHSNDWGTEATEDVIEGTTKILAEHDFLDPKRIGAYGGSYGGFITLDLATKTDMFTALVDMYGISNIASYFGGGTWGYWYGDLALPGSLPWKDRDIFIEKSPLYHADKIKTPMFILHGAADHNVPPNESDQMFMALKILGQDVAYVRFDGESHNINDKFENLITHREMMLEWFDKYLKGEPQGWKERWKE